MKNQKESETLNHLLSIKKRKIFKFKSFKTKFYQEN